MEQTITEGLYLTPLEKGVGDILLKVKLLYKGMTEYSQLKT